MTRLVRRSLALRLFALLAALASRTCAEEFDLTGLSAYVAETPNVHGVIRIHDSELTQNLVHLWEDRFLKLHPLVRYSDYTVPAWFTGLCADTADFAVAGRGIYLTEIKSFESVYGYPPLEIKVATGGFDKRKGNTPGVIIFVNKDNPLSGLTLEQLDGILGAQRSGGWIGSTWSTAAARGPEKNLRTWGQLGVTGKWADKPISIYGLDATLSGWSGLIQQVVFHGGDKWNPSIHEIVRGGTEVPADAKIVAMVADDPYALGFSFMRVVEQNPGVKALPIAEKPGGAFVAPTSASFFDRSYPLVTAVYIYMNRAPGKPVPPRLKEFLRYILSKEGSQAVMDDGMYIPLDEAAIKEELKKLD